MRDSRWVEGVAAAVLATVVLPAGLASAAATAAAQRADAPAAEVPAAEAPAIRGAWRPISYVLASGAAHSVDGLIQFGEADWSVVFFVLDPQGRPRRASAEGGTYVLEDDRVVFTHRFNLSAGEEMEGLPSQEIIMAIAAEGEGTTEPTRWEVEDELLVLRFPSGNQMVFTRRPPEASRPERPDDPGGAS